MSNDTERALAVPLKDVLWSENFALAMADAKSGTSFLLSIGTWFADPTVWREKLTVVLPDGRMLVARNYGRATQGDTVGASLARYEIVEDGKRIRFRFDGPMMAYSFEDLLRGGAAGRTAGRASIDVEFRASAPMWFMHGEADRDETGIMGAMHDEQLGHCTGYVSFEGVTIEISKAHACRDHSRGTRDMRHYRAHAWINGQFDDGRGFQLYHAHLQGRDDPALAKAVIAKEGKLIPARIEGLTYIAGPTDHGRTHDFLLISEDDVMHVQVTQVIGSVVTGVLAPFEAFAGAIPGQPHITIFDEVVLLKCDGVTGTGMCERGIAPPGWGSAA
jgi:hypothetical protein